MMTTEQSAPSAATLSGPPPQWLWGNLGEFRRGQLAFYERCREQYGPLVPFRLGWHRFLMVCEPSAIEEVLVSKNRAFHKHYVLRFLKPVLGQGLLTSEGDLWLRQRRMVQPAFARAHLVRYAESMTRHAAEVSSGWAPGSRRNIHRDFMQLTLQIAAETMLGVTLREECQQVGEALETVQQDFSQRFSSLVPLPTWAPTPGQRKLRSAIQSLENLIARLVAERTASPSGSVDALSALLTQFPPGESGALPPLLRDEVMTLLLAGHDTTSNALAWTFYLLAQHPGADQRLADEVRNVVGGRLPTFDDVAELHCTRQVVQESLRLYPPAYAFGREAIQETTVGGVPLRKGDNIVIPQWVIHRDPRFYEDPLKFSPERWTESFAADLPHFAYLPFGGGPRVCIGNQFAMLELVLIVATIVQKFRLRLEPGRPVVPEAAATLRPKGGLWMFTDPR